MNSLAIFIALVLFVLLQVAVIPVNLGLTFLVALSLFAKNFSFLPWIILLSVLVALFSNLSVGIVLLAFATTFFGIKFGSDFLPDNNLIKVFLIIAAIPLSELTIIFFSKITL